MRPRFPGMDPWLEHPDLWPDVHNSLITAIRDSMIPLVVPHYIVRVESRTTVLTAVDADHMYRPDVAIWSADLATPRREAGVAVMERTEVLPIEVSLPVDEIEETYLTIKELPGHKLVTVMEVLSPTNKKTEKARTDYLEKRQDLIRSGVNFVEIDLLRAGEPMPLRGSPPPSDYRILICRQRQRRTAHLYSFSYKVPIPAITIPLLSDDAEPTLDLNAILHALIDRARYDLSIDYCQPPRPPLRPGDESWSATILAQPTEGVSEKSAGGETAP
jgi:uncharacterized protein DUF4058